MSTGTALCCPVLPDAATWSKDHTRTACSSSSSANLWATLGLERPQQPQRCCPLAWLCTLPVLCQPLCWAATFPPPGGLVGWGSLVQPQQRHCWSPALRVPRKAADCSPLPAKALLMHLPGWRWAHSLHGLCAAAVLA